MLGLGLMSSFAVIHGLARLPGSVLVDVDTLVTSRPFVPKPLPQSSDAITIVGGTYSLYISGVWTEPTADAGTWGSAKKARISTTSSTEYSTPTEAVMTIGGVDYTFTATTIPASGFPYTFPFQLG
jgi:hypothetical protein